MHITTRIRKVMAQDFPEGGTATELSQHPNLAKIFNPKDYPNPAISIGRILGKDSKDGNVYQHGGRWYLEGTGPGRKKDENARSLVPSASAQPATTSDKEFEEMLMEKYGWLGVNTSVQFFPLNHTNVMSINIVKVEEIKDEDDDEDTGKVIEHSTPLPTFGNLLFMIVPTNTAIPDLHPGQRIFKAHDMVEILYVDRELGEVTDTVTIPDYSVLVVAPLS